MYERVVNILDGARLVVRAMAALDAFFWVYVSNLGLHKRHGTVRLVGALFTYILT